ncbi:UvrD-helicase domain-containing protein [Bradyrhizobium sp. U87765 SZCCT0131]|uniref:UvrD-helicase domain-containing protein n=1 Tax=unclassified Bradyrhizobium TaxID=2631580 RepID=UPI001BA83278|nr:MULTISPECIES: UvrD-helicase domain-containing protein [unclassified Bradyrhizobium]MBR1216411.1 UvrD-helicase domain-containing protein [Bradyrhizobium sp. U87765 SZCCT0131]MBR1259841.1 UvrD-helicase domain-containing protein [Bradyrhizobium sp. U87765 SZCCT0134]MBR1305974.1 UvrD-helicase domain-containing protein [Bradyrhizobium sp. U87765 SZCCT0110]MBR1322341.1 UvrD-helicase domain-containing protein [Bradyrhizobium sp. U87765 SZCCT0109]MBR1352368.1 UvrD-helicase domain-containing protein
MNFLIADTFTASFNRLSGPDQKAVKASVFDLQIDPAGNGLQLHRIDKSKDPNFWSARVNRDIRLIVHKTGDSLLVAYVGHHDDAYAWAERRRIEAHPRTGAIQIVEVRERAEEIAPPPRLDFVFPQPANGEDTAAPALFASLDDDALLSIGVPADWLADVRAASEDGFFALTAHLPAEASEALLEYAATGRLAASAPAPAMADPFAHPDALRRIRLIADQEELEQALAFAWEKWGVFLHPSQRALVERSFAGPARVAGSAGTGKTIVAIHRAVRLARDNPNTRVLLASFSQPLAAELAKKVLVLAPETGGIVPRITTASFQSIAEQMFQLEHGVRPRIASDAVLRERLRAAVTSKDLKGFSERFLLSEWTNVVDAWGLTSLEAYTTVQRMGRKSRLGPNQRARLWPVFQAMRDALVAERYTTWANVFTGLADALAKRETKPFDHIVIDEAQDLAPAELRFFAALAPAKPNGLFLSGDVGQRIFQHPFSWASLGVDVRGRSNTLKVCYRTSQQIRRAADRLLPTVLRDTDGLEDERSGIVSVFAGPAPEVKSFATIAAEADAVRQAVEAWLGEGIAAREIGLFVRTSKLITRARHALSGVSGAQDIVTGPMSLAKGLEFRAVVIMACDQGILPLDERVAGAADEAELDDIYETERRLLYVACTRAREHLLLTGVEPTSEYLKDFLAAVV